MPQKAQSYILANVYVLYDEVESAGKNLEFVKTWEQRVRVLVKYDGLFLKEQYVQQVVKEHIYKHLYTPEKQVIDTILTGYGVVFLEEIEKHNLVGEVV